MKVVNEESVLALLKGLDRQQCTVLLNDLHRKLAECSEEEKELSKNPSHEREIFQPLRTNITTKNSDTTLVMPASDTKTTSVKILTAPHSGNLTAMLSFFSPDGTPLGIISATTLTPFRTALTVMILFSKYAGSKKRLVFFGAGRQTEWHVRLSLLLHDEGEIEEISIVNRTQERSQNLIRTLNDENPSVQFNAKSLDDIDQQFMGSVNGIFTCTPSRSPLFPNSVLDPNSHYFISLIGSYVPEMHEIDESTLLSGLCQPGSQIYVDSRSACLEESGELIDAKIKPEQLVEIGEIPQNHVLSVPNKGNTLVKAVGMGMMDLSTGMSLLNLAIETQQGIDVPW